MSSHKVRMLFWTGLMLFAVVGAGCGPKTPTGPVTLHVLTTNQVGMTADDWNAVAQQFTAANPKIQVQLSFATDTQVEQEFTKGMTAYPPSYDVVMVNPTWIDVWIKAGYLADVSSRVTQDMQQNIYPGAWGGVTRAGKVYGVPWLPDMKFLYYNRDLMAQVGYFNPPKTWEDLTGMAQTIKDKGLVQFPITWFWKQPEDAAADFTALLAGDGGTFLDNQNRPALNNPKGVAALSWLKQTIDEGLTDPASLTFTEADVRRTFETGQTAFVLDWFSLYDQAQFDKTNSPIAGKVGIGTVPVFQSFASSFPSASVDGTRSLGIASSSLYMDQAWDFIAYVVSLDVQMKYASAQLPVWTSAYADGDLNVLRNLNRSSPVAIPVFGQQFKYIHPLPTISYFPAGAAALQQAMQLALTGKKTPQDALNAAAAQWAALAK